MPGTRPYGLVIRTSFSAPSKSFLLTGSSPAGLLLYGRDALCHSLERGLANAAAGSPCPRAGKRDRISAAWIARSASAIDGGARGAGFGGAESLKSARGRIDSLSSRIQSCFTVGSRQWSGGSRCRGEPSSHALPKSIKKIHDKKAESIVLRWLPKAKGEH